MRLIRVVERNEVYDYFTESVAASRCKRYRITVMMKLSEIYSFYSVLYGGVVFSLDLGINI